MMEAINLLFAAVGLGICLAIVVGIPVFVIALIVKHVS